MGLCPDNCRHPLDVDAVTQEFGSKIVDIAHARRRFGYQCIHNMLRTQLPRVNHKEIYQLHSAANLAGR